MQLSDGAAAAPSGAVPTAPGAAGTEPCRFPKLEECAHFHYERVQLPRLHVTLQTNMDQSLHSQHTVSSEDCNDPNDWYTLQVTCRDECWLIQRNLDNFAMLDAQLHQCIYDRKVSQLPDIEALKQRRKQCSTNNLVHDDPDHRENDLEIILSSYLDRLCSIVDNSLNCGPILNWFQLDNKGHRLLVPSEESRSINTPAVAAAYSIRKYVSQARDELSLEVGDMISVIDMASPGESVWWRGKRGFQVGFFPQHCVHIIGDKVPRNMPLPPPVVGSLAISPIKPVLRKHGKLITFFRSFILNRPSRRRLKQSGILKERVFGCDLGEHLLNSGHDIPMVLKCCAEFIEKNGIVDGIYRLSGVTSNIQKLRNAFDEDRIPNLYTDDILQDIHSVASLLKMYFRELPNPLCTYQLYHSFVSAVQGCSATRNKASDNERLLKMREAVQKLPPPHYRTLEYLMRHLARVAKHGASTGMTTRNVAIVWAPNLLRCEELEVGGVAALQGVGVQAVVTEFLVCYADLIFSDHLPNLPDPVIEKESAISPKRSRPKSLAISTPTKLLTLEEARNKHLLNKSDEGNYIEVGGGPKTLPKKYHTVIELPAGSRKRGLSKRSPSGWRSFFSKSRNSSHGNLSKNRDISSPGIIPIDKSVTESDLNEIKRKLRPVKSAESLTSGQSEPATCESDVLGPLHCLTKPPGHNRSVSHDSYFDNLQNSTNNSVGSLLDLSEIQLNFELEESEMRIFSEDESLVSSPKVQKESVSRKGLSRARQEDYNSSVTSSSNPSPKKQARVVMSPDSMSRKRSRLEDQLSDIQYIDCNTPENPCTISTTAVIHNECNEMASMENIASQFEGYQPKNKSPRNSDVSNRHSLNFEKIDKPSSSIPKSLTETDIKAPAASHSSGFNLNLTPTPQTPNYKPLDDTSTTNTPILSPENSYQNIERFSNNVDSLENRQSFNSNTQIYENVSPTSKSPTYENILTTISITYRSPVKTRNPDNIYEDIELNPEQAVVPTTMASLPVQEASQPYVVEHYNVSPLPTTPIDSPRLSLETTFDSSITTICSDTISGDSNTLKDDNNIVQLSSSENLRLIKGNENVAERPKDLNLTEEKIDKKGDRKSLDSTGDVTKSLDVTATYKSIDSSITSTPISLCDNYSNSKKSLITPTDEMSMSEIVQSSVTDTSPTSTSSSKRSRSPTLSPVVSPINVSNCTSQLSHLEISSATDEQLTRNDTNSSRSSTGLNTPTRSQTRTSLEPICKSFGSTDELSSPVNKSSSNSNNDKRKSCDAEIFDENAIYQQVKYFRRSIHEINSLLDLPSDDNNTPLTKSKSVHHSLDNLIDVGPKSSMPNLNVTPEIVASNANANNVIQNVNTTTESHHTLVKRLEDNLEIKPSRQENFEHFDSLEAENVHLYENVDPGRSHKDLDVSRSRMHESEPKTIDLAPEAVQELPVCSKCCEPMENTNTVQKINVKNLTSKFETKENKENAPKIEEKRKETITTSTTMVELSNNSTTTNSDKTPITDNNTPTAVTPQAKVIKHVYDKDSLPPCLRAKNAKNSIKTRSLDENAFVTEFGRSNMSLQRRKSLDDRTSSYINSKMLIEPQKVSSSTTDIRLESQRTTKPTIESLTSGIEQKLNRERIEKYKEERRNFWREKYRSESFREDKDKLLSRLKQKSFKTKNDESEITKDSLEPIEQTNNTPEYKNLVDRTVTNKLISDDILSARLAKTKESDSCLAAVCKKLPMEALSKFEKDGAITKPASFRKHHSPLMDRKNRPSLKEISDKILDDTTDETVVLRAGTKEDEFLRHRRGDGESERRRHTYDLLRERDFDSDTPRRVSLETKTPRKEKCSPSYCIKDMKAIFESKSQQ